MSSSGISRDRLNCPRSICNASVNSVPLKQLVAEHLANVNRHQAASWYQKQTALPYPYGKRPARFTQKDAGVVESVWLDE
jgi:hypothetical protein